MPTGPRRRLQNVGMSKHALKSPSRLKFVIEDGPPTQDALQIEYSRIEAARLRLIQTRRLNAWSMVGLFLIVLSAFGGLLLSGRLDSGWEAWRNAGWSIPLPWFLSALVGCGATALVCVGRNDDQWLVHGFAVAALIAAPLEAIGSVLALLFLSWVSACVASDALLNRLGAQHRQLNEDARRLLPLTRDRCTEVLAVCRDHPILAAYHAQSVSLGGRVLTHGDADAMIEWARRSHKNQPERTKQLAWALLRQDTGLVQSTPISAA